MGKHFIQMYKFMQQDRDKSMCDVFVHRFSKGHFIISSDIEKTTLFSFILKFP